MPETSRTVMYYTWNRMTNADKKNVTHVNNGHEINPAPKKLDTWFCGNNYTRYGCHGHRPDALRCMDLG